jgi:putative endonuclease
LFVYILKCKDNSLYTGIASDINRRIRQHLNLIKGGAKYTRSHRVVSVELLLECDDSSACRKMECAIKKLSKPEKNDIISSKEILNRFIEENFSESEFRYIDRTDLNDFLLNTV